MSEEPIDGVAPLFEADCEFWMVWNKNGPPQKTHHSEADAMRVAAIMARKHPGRTFIVMKGFHKFNTKEFSPWPRPDPWHWLSFADADLPKGSQFLGAVILRAPDFMTAVAQAHTLGLNPGGEVVGVEAPKDWNPPEEMTMRLLTREEAESIK